MFTYKISPKANVQQFKKVQRYLEDNLDVKAMKELVDVDGSRVKCYKFNGKDLFVVLDVDFDSIIVRSEINIRSFLRRPRSRRHVGINKPTSVRARKEDSSAMTKSRETWAKRTRFYQLKTVSD